MENPKGADRIANAVTSTNREASKTDVLFKDHKPIGEDGLLKTRKVSNCIGSTTEILGDLLALVADIVQTREEDKNSMIKSTEEHIAESIEFNNEQDSKMEDRERRILGGMDVIGLYVNVQPERAAEELFDEVIEGGFTISHNIDECAKFIAVNLERKEISDHGLEDSGNLLKEQNLK